MRLLSKVAIGLALVCSSALSFAQGEADYPNKPIKWIVGYPPGGTTDVPEPDEAMFTLPGLALA